MTGDGCASTPSGIGRVDGALGTTPTNEFQEKSSSSVRASRKSWVSKPSVNQLYAGNNSARYASYRPCRCHMRVMLVAARSSHDFARCSRATVNAFSKRRSA